MDEFQQYQSFANAEVSQSLLTLLRHHHIIYETSLDEPAYSLNMAFNATDTRFVVRLRPDDFEAARRLEDELNQHFAAQAAPDHYLFGFPDDELFDILVKPDEWNSYDVTLASHILRSGAAELRPMPCGSCSGTGWPKWLGPSPARKPGYLLATSWLFWADFWARSSVGTCTITKKPCPMAPRYSRTRPTTGRRVFAFSCWASLAYS